MPFRWNDWPPFLARLAVDLLRRKFKAYGRIQPPHPTRHLSPTGLAMACDACGGAPYVIDGRLELLDLETYRRIPDGGVIWMRIEALPAFNREVLPSLRSRFVLVTGESDWSVPSNFYWAARTVVHSGKLIRWFSVNYDGSAHGDIITPVPIGVEYPKKNEFTLNLRVGSYRAVRKTPAEHEAEWDRLAREAPPLERRRRVALADFHFNETAFSRKFGETRAEIRERLAGNPCIWWPEQRGMDPLAPRLRYAQCVFVIVTYGRGLDGHRLWEALLMGCIVIVKKGPLDVLYRGLPVVSIDEWEDITAANLARWFDRYGPNFPRTPVHETLSLDHWTRRIRAAAAAGTTAAVPP